MTSECGTRARYARGCRCLPCCDANKAYQNEWRARQVPPPEGDARHGRTSTYINRNCRCQPCCDAMRVYHRKHSARAILRRSE